MGRSGRFPDGRPRPLRAVALFVEDVLAKREGIACCRIRIAELEQFWALLTRKLHQRGLQDKHIREVLRGRLFGQCPRCLLRFDAEYLAWLVEHRRTGAPDREMKRVARFAEGRCINEECSSFEWMVYWRPRLR
ncbi:MAG: hypothetical protein K6V36_15435 [Anaerolineae bacterium]|nr:hypothetical protein [Anaerolineae bacterium]